MRTALHRYMMSVKRTPLDSPIVVTSITPIATALLPNGDVLGLYAVFDPPLRSHTTAWLKSTDILAQVADAQVIPVVEEAAP